MKNIYKHTIAIAALLGLASCDLTLLPEDTVSPDLYFSSATELQSWSNHFYNLFETAETYAGRNADDVIDKAMGSIILGTRDPQEDNDAKNEWNWTYLRDINYCLEHMDQCKDAASVTKYSGVCYFFRALCYYEKMMRFGDLPWYDKVLSSEDDALLKKPQDSRDFIAGKILEDIDKAVDMLPSTKEVYRVTHWTALALKSRFCLFEGTWRKYHGLKDADMYLELAAQASEDFIDHSGYVIYKDGKTPYYDLFTKLDSDDTEIILSRRYSQDAALSSSLQFNLRNSATGFTKRFMNHYLKADGSRFTDIADYGKLSWVDETTGRDPRMAQTVLCPGFDKVRNVGVTGVSQFGNDFVSFTGYEPVKFALDCSETDYSGASKSFSDFPLFRAAEVYLNFAEAKAELGTLTQADLDKSIKHLRDRVGMPALSLDVANANVDTFLSGCYPNVTVSANTGVILEIRRERTVELVMEGLRQWDMLRWKEGLQMVNTNPYYGMWIPGPGIYDMDGDGKNDTEFYKDKQTSQAKDKLTVKKIGVDFVLSEGDSGYIVAYNANKFTFDETKDYLWPVPVDQRVLTGGNLHQNPGWTDNLSFNGNNDENNE